MTGRWSSQIHKVEFKDLQANTMAVDSTGQLVLLAGRRSLGLVNLTKEAEGSELRKIPRQSKWEVSACQWNPHKSHSNLFITACNQRADIWSWDDEKGLSSPLGSLKAHTRVISDLDWSTREPNMVATCSGDAYAFLWDIRDTKKPAVSLQAVVGASQVQWNKVNAQLLATAHDGDIRIWDPRKGTVPVQYIAGHLSKVHGLDWSPTRESKLTSSSQDHTVKFWDVNNPKSPEGKLTLSSPVWRARYTPNGDGLATVMVPQLRRGENSLLLWQLNDLRQPVHTFMGHQDVILEFHWRCLSQDSDEYQLVSWSRDHSLRLWKLESSMDKMYYENNMDLETGSNDSSDDIIIPVAPPPPTVRTPSPQTTNGKDTDILPATPPNSSFARREEIHSPQQPKTLQHEFTLANLDIPNVTVEEMDDINRTFTASAQIGQNIVKLTMIFPHGYPNSVPPEFVINTGNTVNQELENKLKKVLMDTSLLHVRNNRSCIEPCLRQLISTLTAHTENLQPDQQHSQEPSNLFMMHQPIPSQLFMNFYSYMNESVPYPRTCGARFCGAGFLVCFSKSTDNNSNVRRTSSNLEFPQRNMSFNGYAQSSRVSTVPNSTLMSHKLFSLARSPPTESLMSYHSSSRKPRSRSKTRGNVTMLSDSKNQELKKAKTSPVIIYNIACLMPINKQLAENYVMDNTDLPTMCNTNANVAAAVGRRDLVQMWSLAALATSEVLKPSLDPDKGTPWAMHPFGRKLFTSLLQYYSSIHDVQTMAMICCVFSDKFNSDQPLLQPKVKKAQEALPNYNLYHTIPPTADTTHKGWNITMSLIRRSNSWSNMTNEAISDEAMNPGQKEREKHAQNMCILDPNCTQEYDQYKYAYGEILYRWQLFNQRSQLLKYVSSPVEQPTKIDFAAACQRCQHDVTSNQCGSCRHYSVQCVVCHISVKGWSTFCLGCGHGGHTKHLMDWFKTHNECPSGCGCLCLEDKYLSSVPED